MNLRNISPPPLRPVYVPSPIGNAGKYLTTDGTSITWNKPSDTLPAGMIVYDIAETLDGFVPCTDGYISTASYPTLAGKLPYKAGFAGAVGAEYGNPNVTVEASSVYVTGYEGYRVLDGLSGNNNNGWHSDYSSYLYNYDTFLKFTFPFPVVLNSYYLAGRPEGSWVPTLWLFQGSNDGISWSTLDDRSSFQSAPVLGPFSGPITTAQMSQYTFTNTTAYSVYRIIFLYNNYWGPEGYIFVSEMVLSGTPIGPDTTLLTVPNIPTQTIDGVSFYAHMKY